MRPLNCGDLFTITDILIDAVEAGSSKIGTILVPEVGGGSKPKSAKAMSKKQLMAAAEKQGIRTVVLVLKECWKFSRGRMQEWFADLCEMTPEQFSKAPIKLSLDIWEFFSNDPENRDFFSRALQVARKTNESLDSLLAGLGLSDTTTESVETSSDA